MQQWNIHHEWRCMSYSRWGFSSQLCLLPEGTKFLGHPSLFRPSQTLVFCSAPSDETHQAIKEPQLRRWFAPETFKQIQCLDWVIGNEERLMQQCSTVMDQFCKWPITVNLDISDVFFCWFVWSFLPKWIIFTIWRIYWKLFATHPYIKEIWVHCFSML